MSGVEVTPCCCQENRPCCVTIVREAAQCTCLEKGPECPDSVLCEPQPPRPVILDRFVRCVGSADECDRLAQEYCQQNPNTISCSGTYYQQLTCDQIADAECDPIPFKVCQRYECGWCEPIVTGCYVDYTDNPCPGPPTCTPDPCCDPEPPTICCCRDENGVRSVVAPCPDPIPPNCFQIQDQADCQNCGEYYTPLPCTSICCCTTPNCVVLWDLTPQPPNHCASGFPTPKAGCIVDPNNCTGAQLVLNYCCCSCFPCEYCSADIAQLNACLADMTAAGHNCLCPVEVTSLCNCNPASPLTGPSESAAPPPVNSLESGVVLDSNNKPTINNLFLLGYGTFNL